MKCMMNYNGKTQRNEMLKNKKNDNKNDRRWY